MRLQLQKGAQQDASGGGGHLLVSSASQQAWLLSPARPRSAGGIIELSDKLAHTLASFRSQWKVN